jgi:hypothetical protein
MLYKFLNRFSSKPDFFMATTLLVLVLVVSSNFAYAQEVKETKELVSSAQIPAKTNSDIILKKSNGFIELDQRQPELTAKVSAFISVPHNISPVNTFVCYPYPVKPPRFIPLEKLPTNPKMLEGYLLNSGYINRIDKDKPYPQFGWRWQYAYNAALKRSKMGVPHTMFTMYSWSKEMVRYALPEVKKCNDKEDERAKNYSIMLDQYERNHVDLETESIRFGLYPVVMKRKNSAVAEAKVPVGNWWLTAMHKVPGLTYYWQIPFTAKINDTVNIRLTEDNALVIHGGW